MHNVASKIFSKIIKILTSKARNILKNFSTISKNLQYK